MVESVCLSKTQVISTHPKDCDYGMKSPVISQKLDLSTNMALFNADQTMISSSTSSTVWKRVWSHRREHHEMIPSHQSPAAALQHFGMALSFTMPYKLCIGKAKKGYLLCISLRALPVLLSSARSSILIFPNGLDDFRGEFYSWNHHVPYIHACIYIHCVYIYIFNYIL